MRDEAESSELSSRVRERRVFFVPGYDPRPARAYRELYRSEGAKQAARETYSLEVSGLPSRDGRYFWQADMIDEGVASRAVFEHLGWSDIVRGSMAGGVVQTYLLMLRTIRVYVRTGALRALLALRPVTVLTAFYPVTMLGLQAGLALWLCLAIAGWVGGAGGAGLGTLAGAALLEAFRRADGVFLAHYLMRDYAFAASRMGEFPPEIDARLDLFAQRVAEALDGPADEVLVVAHSAGAELAVALVARVRRLRRIANSRLGLVTLGQAIPMRSFLPQAQGLRRDLAELSAAADIVWIDVSAPGDGVCYALTDPVAVSGVKPEGARWPLVVSAAFRETVEPGRFRRLRWRFFRAHLQYVCAFARPGVWEYFHVTAGSYRLGARFAGRVSNSACKSMPLSPFRDVAGPPEHLPPKPVSRADRVSPLARLRLFRENLFASQPARLYRARMAEQWTPFFRSFALNEPELVRQVLKDRPRDFPKSPIIGRTLRGLLGRSVFVTNGEEWERQRRIIDPAFEGGRIREFLPQMHAACTEAVARLGQGGRVEIEAQTSHLAADIIFRTLFSMPIGNEVAAAVFERFRAYQRAQPLLSLADIARLPSWVPRRRNREAEEAALEIRALLQRLTQDRLASIAAGEAPDDLATKILTTRDPLSRRGFDAEEMVDQVAIFFLAGHETSASALAWTLWLLADNPHWQDQVAAEAEDTLAGCPDMAALSRLKVTRDVFREALRLYPPVPMMVREAACPAQFRGRRVPKGSQIVISPWHMHRHERLWRAPDAFDPLRWRAGPEAGSGPQICPRDAYLPFSTGPRVCPGAGFAMAEGVLATAMLARTFRFATVPARRPEPVAHLTVRARDGIWLDTCRRNGEPDALTAAPHAIRQAP